MPRGLEIMARILDDFLSQNNLIGKNLKKIRKDKRISQRELANKLELLGIYICRGSISRIEEGLRTVTDIELAGLAKVLEIEISDLMDTAALPFEKDR